MAKAEKKNANLTVHLEVVHQRVADIAKEFSDDLEALIEKKERYKPEDLEIRKMSLAFVHFAIKTVLGLDDEEALACLTDGYGDFGVDAIHIGEVISGEFTITILQGKYVFNLIKAKGATFPENDGVNRVIPAVRFIPDPDADIPANKLLKPKIEAIRSLEAGGAIPRIRVLLCNNGVGWSSDAQKLIEMENFGDGVIWEHVGPADLGGLLFEVQPKEEFEPLQLSGKYLEEKVGNVRYLISRMKVSDVATLVGKRMDDLFAPNVRGFLGISKSSINSDIRLTILDEADRDNFYLYNNGLTLICEEFKYYENRNSDLPLQVKGAYVLNGGQTCRTIQETVSEMTAGGDANTGEASVLIRLYELPEGNEELAGRIALSTNSQNPVNLRDLRSNDRIQLGLEAAIQGLGYVYHRSKGEKPIRGAKNISPAIAAESVLAIWRKMPHEACSHEKKHFGDYYKRIFPSTLTAGQVVLATKILRFAKSKARADETDSAIVRHGAHLIAMLMGQFLLKEVELEKTVGIKLDQLNQELFATVDAYYEKNETRLFNKALEELTKDVNTFGDEESRARTPSEVSALFRKREFKVQVICNRREVKAS